MAQTKSIILVQNDPTVDELIPNYSYRFQDETQSNEAVDMYQSLIEFIRTNSDIALQQTETTYAGGFKKALALTHLWIDSMYLNGENHGK